MHRGVEAPFARLEAKALDHLQLELLLALDREGRVAHRALTLGAGAGHERHLLLLEPVEHGTDLGRLHARLEVVQQNVVGLVVVVEALDVAATQLEVLAQRRDELREVGLLTRLHPDGHRQRAGAPDLALQLRRDTPRLLPLAANEPDQARLVGVVRLRLLERPEPVEQAADLVTGERLVREPAHRRELLRPNRRAAGRHLHLLVPGEQRRSRPEIRDLGDALLQLGERRLHGRQPTEPEAHGAALAGRAGRRGSSEDDLPLRVAVLRCRQQTGSESAAGRAWTRRLPRLRHRALLVTRVTSRKRRRFVLAPGNCWPSLRRQLPQLPQASVDGRLRARRLTPLGQLAQRERRVAEAEAGNLAQPLRELVQLPCRLH